MSGSNSDMNVSIRTANGTANDIKVQCKRDWCMFDLKVHLSTVHPLHPVRDARSTITVVRICLYF